MTRQRDEDQRREAGPAPAGRVSEGAALALGDVRPEIASDAFLAPGAVLVGDVRLGRRASVWYGSVLRADNDSIVVGEDSNVQDGCILHADPGQPIFIGDRVTVGHRAIVHAAHVESDSLIGMGSVVLNGARVGSGSLVAAGAVVRPGMQIPPGSMVAGVPAVVRRAVNEAERETIRRTPPGYIAKAQRHRGARP